MPAWSGDGPLLGHRRLRVPSHGRSEGALCGLSPQGHRSHSRGPPRSGPLTSRGPLLPTPVRWGLPRQHDHLRGQTFRPEPWPLLFLIQGPAPASSCETESRLSELPFASQRRGCVVLSHAATRRVLAASFLRWNENIRHEAFLRRCPQTASCCRRSVNVNRCFHVGVKDAPFRTPSTLDVSWKRSEMCSFIRQIIISEKCFLLFSGLISNINGK